MVTLYDVARFAGVSTATVSRVLHGPDRVRDSTRARVLRAISELGYVPDGAAQSLARSRKEVIGLVCVEHTGRKPGQDDVESMSLLFYDEVLRGVESGVRDLGWSLLITYLREDETRRAAYLPGDEPVLPRLLALSGKVDGLLIGEGVVPPELITKLAARLPVVLVAGNPAGRGADVVAADSWSGSAALVTHLVADHGRKRIFHVDGPPSAPDARARRRALMHVINAHPGAGLTGSVSGRFSVRSGEQAGEKLLAERAMPDAIVCANDQMAIGVLRALAARGVQVPDDVAVVGFDDIFPASLCDPPLTTVHQPMRLLGERAFRRLTDRLADPAMPPAAELLPTELVLRSSCGCPPGTVRRLPATDPRPRPAGGR